MTNSHSDNPAQRCTVLVVDDDRNIRAILARWLMAEGYAVITAEAAEEALSICRECVIDIALCDVMLPGLSGTWLAGQIQQVSPRTQIIFATADEHMAPADTLKPGVVGYVVKPFERDDFFTAVDRARHAAEYLCRLAPAPRLPDVRVRSLSQGKDGLKG